MTTMRSVEPPSTADVVFEAVLGAIFPPLARFLAGTDPEPGEHGVDRHGRVYVWTPDVGGWVPDLPWWGNLPGMAGRAEQQWQAHAEMEAG